MDFQMAGLQSKLGTNNAVTSCCHSVAAFPAKAYDTA